MDSAYYEAIARRRYQCPTPKRHGRCWTIQVRIDQLENGDIVRKLKRVALCLADQPLREALRLRDEYVKTLNSGWCGAGSAISFRQFVRGTYLRCESALLAKSTLERYNGVLKNHLLPVFGDKMLRELTPACLQEYFTGFAGTKLSHESVDKIRDVLSTVLRLAAGKYGLLSTNPMKNISLPRRRVGNKPKSYISPEQFDQLVNAIPEPYATMVNTAVYSGLRVSELAGLKWRSLGHSSIRVDERYCRGDWSEPKSRASNAVIAVDRSVVERIHRLKILTIKVRAGAGTREHKVVKKDGPDDLVFQSVREGRPMRDNNILTRYLRPAGRKLGFDVNWRCLRTSCATWMIEAGANPKDVQGHMRHSRIQTTLDVYAQFVPASERRAIELTKDMADRRIAAFKVTVH